MCASRCALAVAAVLLLAGFLLSPAALPRAAATEPDDTAQAQLREGRELFLREWVAADARSHAGDGLGPVYNDSSCVACHNLGGPGGAGPTGKNVDILNAFVDRSAPSLGGVVVRALFGFRPPKPPLADERVKRRLAEVHPGFRAARSVVLHRFSTRPDYEPWRLKLTGLGQFVDFAAMPAAFDGPPPQMIIERDMVISPGFIFAADAPLADVPFADVPLADDPAQREILQIRQLIAFDASPSVFAMPAQHGPVTLLRSQRNPAPLFGLGLLDAIPDEVLRAAAARKFEQFPSVTGRVSPLSDGKIGRFGWKGQTATLREFVLTACAVELGLDVPGHPQAGVPVEPDYKAPGLDLTLEQCDQLTSYVAALPRPVERTPDAEQIAQRLDQGRQTFNEIGCAACHVPDLGEVTGVYTDLLLHDMGSDLSDTGQYGVFVPDAPEQDIAADVPALDEPFITGGFATEAPQPAPNQPATRREWRTPPLWGLRDSGPYLHDGRAPTIEQAIALHDGEAAFAAHAFFNLEPDQRLRVVSFLKSLVAPDLN